MPLKVRRERREKREAILRLVAAGVLPVLAYVLAVLYMPGFQANRWILAAFAVWLLFLANVGKVRERLGDWITGRSEGGTSSRPESVRR